MFYSQFRDYKKKSFGQRKDVVNKSYAVFCLAYLTICPNTPNAV